MAQKSIRWTAPLLFAFSLAACAPDAGGDPSTRPDGSQPDTGGATGGTGPTGSGGAEAGTGGAGIGGTGTGGAGLPGTGGSFGTGGMPGAGGAMPGTGGAMPGTGGAAGTSGGGTGGRNGVGGGSGGGGSGGGAGTGGNGATGGVSGTGGRGGSAGGNAGTGGRAGAGGGAGGTAFAPCPAAADCRILPFGDSITDGYNIPGGYRIDLFRRAHSAGKHITFVGSKSNGPGTVDGVDFPSNHEGYIGWRIDQIAAINPSPAAAFQPHIVLLMIGTNDMLQNYNATSAPARLEALLNDITAKAPGALIVVAKLTPLSDAAREARVGTFNNALPALVAKLSAAGKHIMLVDQHTGFPLGELADGIHPGTAGYARMAGVWYAALAPLLR